MHLNQTVDLISFVGVNWFVRDRGIQVINILKEEEKKIDKKNMK